VQQHVKILAILNIVYGSLGLLIGLIVFAVLGGVAGFASQIDSSGDAQNAAPILVLIGTIVVIVLAVVSAPAIIAGVGLLGFKPWARILGIVLSALHLMSIPFGTLLGIYGLWVLLSAQTEAMFRGVPPPPPVPSRPYA
jgi:hypothetical protein